MKAFNLAFLAFRPLSFSCNDIFLNSKGNVFNRNRIYDRLGYQRNKLAIILLLSSLFLSCNSGYQKESGQWVWVSYNESSGKTIKYIEFADNESFKVLSNKDFAKDNAHVFYIGKVIKDADPNTFEVLSDKGFSKDNKHVFLDRNKVVFADPRTFTLLEFPYSKDSERVFCGTLPLNLDKSELGDFKVTNEDKLMAGMKSTTILSHYIELYPEYQWLDTLGIDAVTVGEWATGETRNKKFKGLQEIK